MIQVNHLTKVYKGKMFETKALDDVSFSLQEGSFVAVMGDSGSGKTTLLNILGGMDSATQGEVLFFGTDTQKLSPGQLDKFRKENISFVFQHFALIDEYTVYENLEAPLLARNVKKKVRKKEISEVLKSLGLEDFTYQLPDQLSGGQRQRVALARSILCKAPIILADEPTGALDEGNTSRVMELFQALHKEGKTIILITHDEKVAAYAERMLLLRDGRLIKQSGGQE
ncbi:MAG: ABC transporter ATP-binding protein [Lachnospiraceae bacterium]|nr:ABC transporter ATP-binding protein [Lachnospiraceae bacterium]